MSESPTPTPSPGGASPGGAQPGAHRPFGERFVAALKLDASVYEEVENDPDALPQAAGVVALAAVAGAIGMAGVTGAGGLLSGLVAPFLGWLVWTALVWVIGVQAFKHTSDFGELLRTLGFVFAPQTLMVVAVIPVPLLRGLLGIAVLAMTIVAFVRAVRQALDVDNQRAVLVALLSVAAYVIVVLLLGL